MNPEKSLEQAVSTSLSSSESDGTATTGEDISEQQAQSTEEQSSSLSTEESIDNATLDSLDSCLEQKPLNHPEVIAESDGLIQEKTKKTTLSEISHLEIQNLQEASIIRFVLRTQTLLVKIEKPIINFNLKTVTPIKSPIEPKIEVEVEQLEMETPKSESVESPVDEQSESNLSQIETPVDEQSESNLSQIETPVDEQSESNLLQLETPVDEQSEIKFPDLIEQALDNDKKELKQDGQELNSHVEKIQQWKQRRETLKQGIKAIRGAADQILSDSRQVQESLPSQLQEQLQGRQQGLDLIGKMLNRLLESTEIDTDDNSEYSELPHLSQSDLMTLIEAEQLEQSAEKLIKNKSKEVGIQRWQLVTQQRDLAEQYRKNWLHFVERKVLPILDGINEGQQHAETLVSQLLKDNAEQEDKLKHWLKTYSNLQELFSQLLTDIKVYPMEVKIGESMNYLRYEPFDVQPDSILNNECVKEEIRQGYEYQLEAEKELLVLRPALVVVVKNDQG